MNKAAYQIRHFHTTNNIQDFIFKVLLVKVYHMLVWYFTFSSESQVDSFHECHTSDDSLFWSGCSLKEFLYLSFSMTLIVIRDVFQLHLQFSFLVFKRFYLRNYVDMSLISKFTHIKISNPLVISIFKMLFNKLLQLILALSKILFQYFQYVHLHS